MGRRYVVLQFDDGDRFDYEPPLPHPADVFLERFPVSQQLNADIGATSAVEIDKISAYNWIGPCPDDGIPVLYPPRPQRETGWLAEP
jgi:hypothetical protein